MFGKILLVLVVLVALVLIAASFQPNEFKVVRSTVVNASADKVYPQIDDLKAFDKWNPFMEADPNAKVTYEGVSGMGMSSTWDGNNRMGAGKNTITSVQKDQSVGMRLDFERPMKNTAQVMFTLQPQGSGTLVTWVMTGNNNLMGKVFHLFVNMDKMVGGQFEKGLANLKNTVETTKK